MTKLKYLLKDLLGTSTMLSPSKTQYRIDYPESEPIFNATIMAQNAAGELEKVWFGDLEMTNLRTLASLKTCAAEFKTILYIYRESTVNNAVFNGQMFPYSSFEASVSKRGEILNKS